MESKEEDKSKKTFKSFRKKADQFLLEVNEAGEKLQKEFDEKFDELKVTAEKLKKETESNERWKEVEGNLKKAGGEVSSAFKAVFKRRKS
jgi:vacuolar-type H+-ATPase subunit I/STV1